MPVFLERFVLAVLAAAFISVIVNPLKFDTTQQGCLLVAIVALAYFTAHTVHIKRNTPPPSQAAQPPAQTPVPVVPAEPATAPSSVQQRPTFRATYSIGNFSASPNTASFWLVYGPQAKERYPANVSVLAELINLSDVPQMVKSIGAQMRNSSDPWMPLIRVPTTLPQVNVYGGDREFVELPFLDQLLADRNLQPREIRRGWLFFQYLPHPVLRPGTPELRFNIEDASGDVSSVAVVPPDTSTANLRPWETLKAGERRNIDGLPIARAR